MLTQVDVATERGCAMVSEDFIGAPWIARIAGKELLCEIHLVAVTRCDVVMDAGDGIFVSVVGNGRSKLGAQCERLVCFPCRARLKQRNDAFAFLVIYSRIEDQS